MFPAWATTIGVVGGWMFLAWFARERYEKWRCTRVKGDAGSNSG